MKIKYTDLVDRTTITHSGQTVGSLLEEIDKPNATSPERIYSELQPYLEPFSFVCNDVVSAARPSEQMPYVNAVADYPAGSRQPGWAALFREGHFQLYVGDGKARLFLKGENPARLLDLQKSVIRHPLREMLDAAGTAKMSVEVYAFNNDYGSRTISLDLNPYIVDISIDQLAPTKKPLSMTSLMEFFERGITLEAAEIGEDGELCFYGTPSSRQTVAGFPQSLEDFAVVYRSTFHHGHNAPYISLDRHEDNRYAKVNFGGLLEDTRVGSVVLEADKLFKTMSTGLDPNTRKFVKGKIQSVVPEFETSSERGLRENKTGYTEIRYWFYPDKIQAVTDGRIGAVQNCQFLADAERMDQKVALGRAQRETIDHLNKNFGQYAQALPAYQELNTVGRMMAIVNWLQLSGAAERVDLDALLSVELSAFKTPRRTKKLIAITAEGYPGKGTADGKDTHRKVYCFDGLLEGLKPSISDREIIGVASKRFSKNKDSDFFPSGVQEERSAMDAAQGRIKKMEARLRSLSSTIAQKRVTLDHSDSYEINRFNEKVDEYNTLKAIYSDAVDSYNQSVQGMNRIGYRTHTLVSVGGGINLRPKDFAKPLRNADSPLLQRIRNSKEIIRSSPPSKGGMTRSVSSTQGEAMVTKRSPSPWKITGERTSGETKRKQWSNGGQGNMTVEANPSAGYTRYRVTKRGYSSETTVKSEKNEVVVSSSSYQNQIVATGNFSQGGTIVLSKGKYVSERNTRWEAD